MKNLEAENLETQLEAKDSTSKQTFEIQNFLSNLKNEVIQSREARAPQFRNYERWYKKRHGMRPPKTFPFPGCANIHLPLVDKNIKKIVPMYTSLIDSPGKVAVFRPAPNNNNLIQSKGEAEVFFTHLVQDIMNSHPEAPGFSDAMYLGIDKMGEKGYAVFKTIFSTVTRRTSDYINIEDLFPGIVREEVDDSEIQEQLLSKYPLLLSDSEDKKSISDFIKGFREGKENVEIKFTETLYKAPLVTVRDPRQITTPPDTSNFWSARWIDDEFTMKTNDLKIAARDGKFRQDHVDAYLEHLELEEARRSPEKKQSTGDEIEDIKKQREGISDMGDSIAGVHKIHETGVYYDIDGDGFEEKCIVTWPDGRPDLYFRFIKNPYRHGQWPWVDIPIEINDDRYTSPRGIPEHLDHIQTILTARHNFKLDSMTLTNAPVLKTIIGAVNPGNLRFKPGDNIPMSRPDAVEPLQWDRSGLVFEEREEQSLKAWAEEYLGMIDHTLSSPNNPTQEARTKAEINTVVSERSRVFSHSSKIFLRRLRVIYQQIWELWMQYGDQRIEIFVNGRPLVVDKQRFGGKFYVLPANSPEATGTANELQAAMGDLQLFKGDQMVNQNLLYERYWNARDAMASGEMVLEPSQVSSSQVERQVLEITQMELGFDTPIKQDDDDATHIQVIQKYMADVAAGKNEADEELLRRVTSHARFHQSRLAQKQGQSGVAEKLRTEANQIRGLSE